LQDFLFLPRRVRQPIASLSGGEQNRLILAKLFSKPANVMVLDEPTNDLDMETLELLEEILLEFEGTILLVSHDRAFLDNVVTSSIVFEAPGKVREYVGGYQDWLNQGGNMAALTGPGGSITAQSRKEKSSKDHAAEKKAAKTNKANKPNFRKQKALDKITRDIEKTEGRMENLQKLMAEPGFYDQAPTTVQKSVDELQALQEQADALYAQWEALENGETP
jgi:ABC transport system ATP-binding/permease protein